MYQVCNQGFKYGVKYGIRLVAYEIPLHLFVCSRYPVQVGFPMGVLDQPRGVMKQVNPNVLLTVRTPDG